MNKLRVIFIHGIAPTVISWDFSERLWRLLVSKLIQYNVLAQGASADEIAETITFERVNYSKIGDDAETPRYIETIPKQGFRFVAPVERVSALPQGTTAVLPIRAISPPAPEVAPVAEPHRRRRSPLRTRRFLTATIAVSDAPARA